MKGTFPIQPKKSMVMSSSLAIPILVCSGTEPTSVNEGLSLRINMETRHSTVSNFFAKLNRSYVIAQFSFLEKKDASISLCCKREITNRPHLTPSPWLHVSLLKSTSSDIFQVPFGEYMQKFSKMNGSRISLNSRYFEYRPSPNSLFFMTEFTAYLNSDFGLIKGYFRHAR